MNLKSFVIVIVLDRFLFFVKEENTKNDSTIISTNKKSGGSIWLIVTLPLKPRIL